MADNDADLPEALKGIFIPPQPRLLQEIQNSQDNLDQVAKLISSDPGVSAAVLKTVNSPFYGLNREVSSIKQAVMLLGMSPIVNLVRGLQLRASTVGQKSKVDLTPFWDTAQDTANIAAAIAKQLKLDMADEVYTLGLFSNCGALLFAMNDAAYIDNMKKAYSVAQRGIVEAENYLMKTSHAELGFAVAQQWKLPGRLAEGIQHHHHIAKVLSSGQFDNRFQSLLAVHKIAEHWALLFKRLGGQNQDLEFNAVKGSILEHFVISETDYDDLKAAVTDTLGYLPS
jgi:HD-like signal output (HDOD) protein